MSMTPTPDPPPAAPLTAEQIAARYKAWMAHAIQLADENDALRDRLARAEARERNLRAALEACNCAECLLDEQRMSALLAAPTDGAARGGA